LGFSQSPQKNVAITCGDFSRAAGLVDCREPAIGLGWIDLYVVLIGDPKVCHDKALGYSIDQRFVTSRKPQFVVDCTKIVESIS
jgi:hypothetical protein